VSNRLARSGVIDVIASASPGLDDLVLLGRVKQLERSGDYDLVVVDGPAAGHSLSMLRSADGLGAIARSGPIKAQADEVTAMLTDPARCQVVLVTLPETTPVNEAVETAYSLEEDIGVHLGPIVVNAVDDGPDLALDTPDLERAAPEGSPMRRAAEFRNARRRLQRTERDRLGSELALGQIVLPAVAGALDAAAIDALAATLDPVSEDAP
jgi:anion-transporting  ArsA/GET3 family ATPase